MKTCSHPVGRQDFVLESGLTPRITAPSLPSFLVQIASAPLGPSFFLCQCDASTSFTFSSPPSGLVIVTRWKPWVLQPCFIRGQCAEPALGRAGSGGEISFPEGGKRRKRNVSLEGAEVTLELREIRERMAPWFSLWGGTCLTTCRRWNSDSFSLEARLLQVHSSCRWKSVDYSCHGKGTFCPQNWCRGSHINKWSANLTPCLPHHLTYCSGYWLNLRGLGSSQVAEGQLPSAQVLMRPILQQPAFPEFCF